MKIWKILLCLITTLVVIFTLYLLFSPHKKWLIDKFFPLETQGPPLVTEQKVELTQFFVPVTSFSSDKEEITLVELQKQKLLILEEKEEMTEKALGIENGDFEILPQEEIYNRLLAQGEDIAILPVEEVDFRVKTLKVDGIDLWDKNQKLDSYPLKTKLEITAAEQNRYFEFQRDKLTKVTATGEIILARGVAQRIEEYQDNLYPFHQVKKLLEESDLTISTLEAPASSSCQYCDHCMVFCAEPEYLAGLSYAGIDGVSMAANHIKDYYGVDGITETIEILDENNILHTGAGRDVDEAREPWIKEINGIKFGFLGYNDVVPTSYAATENTAGSAWADINNMVADIQAIKSQVDVVVILAHWGIEYTNFPSARQNEIAHAAIDAGADLIIGDHPHWVQGVEFYRGKFIIYGVGNFVFDQMWSEETRQGTIVDFIFYSDRLASIRFHPTVIEDYVQPRLASKEEKAIILNRIWEASGFKE